MKRRRTFDEIDLKRYGKRELTITVPSIHTGSGCRFSYTAKVDYETYEVFRAREQQKNKEELERNLRIKELKEKETSSTNYAFEVQKLKRRLREKRYYEKHKEEISRKQKEKVAKRTDEERAYYAEKARVRRLERKLQSNESSKEKD